MGVPSAVAVGGDSSWGCLDLRVAVQNPIMGTSLAGTRSGGTWCRWRVSTAVGVHRVGYGGTAVCMWFPWCVSPISPHRIQHEDTP